MTRATDSTADRYGNDGCRLPVSVCGNCGQPLDAATGAYDEAQRPGAGDVSICVRCGALRFFTDDLSLRPPTLDELGKLLADEQVLRVLRVIDT